MSSSWSLWSIFHLSLRESHISNLKVETQKGPELTFNLPPLPTENFSRLIYLRFSLCFSLFYLDLCILGARANTNHSSSQILIVCLLMMTEAPVIQIHCFSIHKSNESTSKCLSTTNDKCELIDYQYQRYNKSKVD